MCLMCSLFLLFVICYLLFVICYLLFVICYLLFCCCFVCFVLFVIAVIVAHVVGLQNRERNTKKQQANYLLLCLVCVVQNSLREREDDQGNDGVSEFVCCCRGINQQTNKRHKISVSLLFLFFFSFCLFVLCWCVWDGRNNNYPTL